MSAPAAPPLSLMALLQPAGLTDPAALYQRLHAEDPIHWDEALNAWIVVRHDDIMTLLQDPRISSARIMPALARVPAEQREELRPIYERLAKQVMFTDPPDHTRLRGLMNRAFTARRMEALRPVVQSIVDGLLDRVQAAGQMDLIRDLAYPLPATVIGDLLGVPRSDQDQFKKWSGDFVIFLGNSRVAPERIAEALRGVAAFIEYFRGLVAEHRAHPQDDLIGALSSAEEQGAMFDEDELFANCMFVLAAGHETTTNLIANGLLLLLQRPDQRAALARDPSLIQGLVEEVLRYESPIRAMGRIVAADMEIGGKQLRQGQALFLMMGAANRDPDRYAAPDVFDLARHEARHIAFGHGSHFCLGAPLARIEGQIAISTVLRRLPALRLADDAPAWDANILFRGLKTLPVLF